MFKKSIKLMAIFFVSTMLLTSCYSYTSIVGKGAQGNSQTTKWNHYVVYGLAPVGISDSKKMANGVKDYDVHTRHTFVSQLVGLLTLGIYTPTVTTVIK